MGKLTLLLVSTTVFLGLVAVASCGNQVSTKQCVVGRDQPCDCLGGKHSTQVCLADGSGFGSDLRPSSRTLSSSFMVLTFLSFCLRQNLGKRLRALVAPCGLSGWMRVRSGAAGQAQRGIAASSGRFEGKSVVGAEEPLPGEPGPAAVEGAGDPEAASQEQAEWQAGEQRRPGERSGKERGPGGGRVPEGVALPGGSDG